jgi:hypothetical protein
MAIRIWVVWTTLLASGYLWLANLAPRYGNDPTSDGHLRV